MDSDEKAALGETTCLISKPIFKNNGLVSPNEFILLLVFLLFFFFFRYFIVGGMVGIEFQAMPRIKIK